jgi:hypothetical protein
MVMQKRVSPKSKKNSASEDMDEGRRIMGKENLVILERDLAFAVVVTLTDGDFCSDLVYCV